MRRRRRGRWAKLEPAATPSLVKAIRRKPSFSAPSDKITDNPSDGRSSDALAMSHPDLSPRHFSRRREELRKKQQSATK
jgi:hypothetical protein